MHHIVKRRCFDVWQVWITIKGLSWIRRSQHHVLRTNHFRIAFTQLGKSVKFGFAKNVHCYVTKIGFVLFTPNMAPVTWVRFAILLFKKWPLPNQSKTPPCPPLTQKLQNRSRFGQHYLKELFKKSAAEIGFNKSFLSVLKKLNWNFT